MATNIKTRIDEANDYAKMINNRESLVGIEDITDYTSVPQMGKDYKPYYDLWTTVETWRSSHQRWLNDALEDVDLKTSRIQLILPTRPWLKFSDSSEIRTSQEFPRLPMTSKLPSMLSSHKCQSLSLSELKV